MDDCYVAAFLKFSRVALMILSWRAANGQDNIYSTFRQFMEQKIDTVR